jgi:V-type H+-transporting ATPase subunit H
MSERKGAGDRELASKQELEQGQESVNAKQQEEKVLQHRVNWDTLANSRVIDGPEKALIVDYCSQSLDDRVLILREKGHSLARLFVKVLNKVHEKETTQHVLALIDQMLQADPAYSRHFHDIPGAHEEILRTLQSQDAYIQEKGAKILALLFSIDVPDAAEENETKFLRWLTGRVTDSKGRTLIQSLTCLKDMLKYGKNAVLFCRQGGLERLMQLIKRDPNNMQLLYLVGFCFWLLSFQEECYPHLQKNHLVREIAAIIRVSSREKVIRICFSTLRNLLNKKGSDEHTFNDDMIGCGLQKTVEGLLSKSWKDKDIEDDLKAVNNTLRQAIEVLSSFEVYQNEVMSGSLQWTPVHTELFWRENINKFEHKNFFLIRQILQILDESKDETAAEVAAYDLGEFARFYPDGKRVIEQMGGKSKLMALMNHDSPAVKKQALLAVQKLMVQNWEFLSKGQGKEKSSKKGDKAK